MPSDKGPLYDLSTDALDFVASYFQDVTVISALPNEVQWSDGKLHDVVDLGWRTTEFPGTFYARVTYDDLWRERAASNIAYQQCAVQQIYVGASDNSACLTGPAGSGPPPRGEQ